jgi:hypothetical protein
MVIYTLGNDYADSGENFSCEKTLLMNDGRE